MGLFKKFNNYAHQSEYRIRIRNIHNSRKPMSFFLGDLSEYASIGKIDDLYKQSC